MNWNPTFKSLALAVCLAAAPPASRAEITIDTVLVGNPGNMDDTTGYGAVTHVYGIGKYEVTNSQYSAFLNAVAQTDTYGLYNTNMGVDDRGGITQTGTLGSFIYSTRTNMADKPVNFVSWFDAARFSNWMMNGQGNGSTETGAYTLSVPDTGVVAMNPGATWYIPSENEWYKAAYYDPGTSGPPVGEYWIYPTRSDDVPTIATADAAGQINNPGANVVNYSLGADWGGQFGNLTTVGSAGPLSASFYGTYDQGGNVFEWNATGNSLRGGDWQDTENSLESDFFNDAFNPLDEADYLGFRIATIPEPSSLLLMAMGGASALVWWRRKFRA